MTPQDHRERQTESSPQSADRRLRAVLFIDYENAYKSAAELFPSEQSSADSGHFHPWKLGETICRRYNRRRLQGERGKPTPLNLIQVRVYWGRFRENDKGGHVQARSQQRRFDAWRNPPAQLNVSAAAVRVEIVEPPRHLPDKWYPTERERSTPVEKEVDTAITVDILTMAHLGELDVAILFSEDGDQRALVCEMLDRFGSADTPRIDLAGWALRPQEVTEWQMHGSVGEDGQPQASPRMKPDSMLVLPKRRLPKGSRPLKHHRMWKRDYRACADPDAYRVSRTQWRELERHWETAKPVRVRGWGVDAKGERLYVDVEGLGAGDSEDAKVRAFVRRGELTDSGDDLMHYIGRSFDALVHEFYPKKGRIELSERRVAQQAAQQELIDSIVEGAVYTGHVSGWNDAMGYVDVDLGHGVKGRIAKGELFTGRHLTPSVVFTRGDELRVFVLKHDRDRKRIDLSATRLWNEEVEVVRVTAWVSGKIGKLYSDESGAWVHLKGPVVGRVAINELTDRPIAAAYEIGLKEGTIRPFTVIGNVEDREVWLSTNSAREAAKAEGWEFDEFDRIKRMPTMRMSQFRTVQGDGS